MKSYCRTTLSTLAALGLAILGWSCSPPSSPAAPPDSLYGSRRDVPVYTEYAEISDLFRQESDTIYVVNLWATWCRPCLEEMPLLARLARETNAPLEVILLSLDKTEDVPKIQDFLEELEVDLPVLVLDTEESDWGREIDRVWNGALPTTVIYQGPRRYVYRRPFSTYADLVSAVSPLLPTGGF